MTGVISGGSQDLLPPKTRARRDLGVAIVLGT